MCRGPPKSMLQNGQRTLSNPNSSALIEAENDNRCLYVVMPMRL